MDHALNQARQAFLDGIEQFESALILLEESIRLAPGRPSVLMNLGVTCVDLGRFERANDYLGQALHCHEKAHDLGADGASFCLIWGQCLAHQGYLPRALKAFEQALVHKPEWAEAWN